MRGRDFVARTDRQGIRGHLIEQLSEVDEEGADYWDESRRSPSKTRAGATSSSRAFGEPAAAVSALALRQADFRPSACSLDLAAAMRRGRNPYLESEAR